MDAFLDKGELDQGKFDANALQVIVEALDLASGRVRSRQCRPGHVLLALWPSLDRETPWADAFEAGLSESCSKDDIRQLIRTYLGDEEGDITLSMNRAAFDADALRVLEQCDEIKDADGHVAWRADPPVATVPMLWVSVLRHRSRDDERHLAGLLDFDAAAAAFACLLPGWSERGGELPELFSAEGSLRLEVFDDSAVNVLETARERAGGLGDDRIRPPHLFLGLLERPDGITEQVIRRRARPGVGPRKIWETLINSLSHGPGVQPRALELKNYHFSETLCELLQDAAVDWARNRRPDTRNQAIGECFLLRAVLLRERNGIVGNCLTSTGMELDIDRLLKDIRRHIRRGETGERITPFVVPVPVAKSEDLTYLGRTGKLPASVGQDALVEQMLRGLHKRHNNHLLITGEAGIGKTELVREFSRRAAQGAIPLFKRKRVVLVNCDGIPPDQSRDAFAKIVGSVKGRNDIVLCLDHFESILKYSGVHESHNRSVVRVALANEQIQLIAILENRYLMELMSHDHALLELFNRVEVREVGTDDAQALLRAAIAPRLESLYGVRITDEAVRRSVMSSREFIMSERLPVKAIRMLTEACERVNYEKDVGGATENAVRDEHVVEAISAYTGIDRSTVAGSGSDVDFRQLLSQRVVDQDVAVKTIASRLDLIKSGEITEGKPAAVLFFAGLTGTGKTELAKAIAQIYSASKKLSVYPMSNFTEAHSISGLLGVPPGYVGYESGGRLINDLNADPYGVILFDEAEKAHPEIWRSMLTLFDEAWIEDRRNVKAFGNRAIFILTSNAGQDYIREHSDLPLAQLREEVSKRLVEYRDPHHGWNTFSPEFLGRFSDIIIFNPLSRPGMKGIVQLKVDALVEEWKSRRDKELKIDGELIDYIADVSHAENKRHGDTKGGRITAQYVDRLIRTELTDLIKRSPGEYEAAASLRVSLAGDDRTAVTVLSRRAVAPAEAATRALQALRSARGPMGVELATALAGDLDRPIMRWCQQVHGAVPGGEVESVRLATRAAGERVREKVDDLTRTIEEQRSRLADVIRSATRAAGGAATGGVRWLIWT